MKNTLKMLIPIGLGLIAATVNWMSLTSSTKAVKFLRATHKIEVHHPISASDFETISIPADQAESLRKSAILARDIGLISGQIAMREIHEGDILLYQDTQMPGILIDVRGDSETVFPVSLEGIRTAPALMRVGDHIKFRIPLWKDAVDKIEMRKLGGEDIGPFRLISVGNTITANIDAATGYEAASMVSIAFNPSKQEMNDRLRAFVDRSRQDDSVKLLSIEIIPQIINTK